MLRRRRVLLQRDETGAVAVVSLLCAIVLLTFAALAVDLGNAAARKGDTQAQADFAALAGARLLPGSKSSSDPVVVAVAEHLVKNAPQDDRPDAEDWPTDTSSMATNLVDGVVANGEVNFTDGGTRMQVISPEARVDFGFAGSFAIFGGNQPPSRIDVGSDATVMVGTPKGSSALPMYVASPCDYGLQTLTDPASGQATSPSKPLLYADTDTNATTLSGITVTDNGVTVTTLPKDSTTGQITVTGNFTDAVSIGFFRSDDATLAPVEVGRTSWVDPVGTTPYSSNNSGAVTVNVPTTVTAVDKLWYVRVLQGGTGAAANKWSSKDEAQPLSVGYAPFECGGGSTSGNFGTHKVPRSTNASSWIELNIAKGVEEPLTLAKFPGSPPPAQCQGNALAVTSTSSTDRKPGTNCLATDTGLTSQTATKGFISGGTADGVTYDGLLHTGATSPDPDGSGGCSPTGDTTTVTILNKPLNNDILTCYLTDTTTDLATVASSSYAGGPRFHPNIYKSPRFAWVPTFGEETVSGTSNNYSIVDFRPAFISDQPMTATKSNNTVNTTTTNGLGMDGTGKRLVTIKVIFINPKALPDGAPDTPIGPYLGVGPIMTRLVG